MPSRLYLRKRPQNLSTGNLAVKRSNYKIHVRQKRKVRELNNELTLDDNFIGVLLLCSKLDSIEKIREHLRPYYPLLVRLYEDELIPIEESFTSGKESYGYDGIESIRGNLSYISGRWRCCFRVRWLIELINPDYKLYDGSFGQL
jgi:hypothetical protein